MAILSMPVFYNFFAGQTNVFLMICVGEFLRAWWSGKPIRAGLWLAGILLKPIFLILLIPYLLFHRYYKTLMGFTAVAVVILAISYLMVGSEGFRDLYHVYMTSALGGNASCPFIMINWRMLGYYLSMAWPEIIGWIAIISGTVITLIITWLIARVPPQADMYKTAATFLGILSATTAVTWHAHSPHLVMLLPLFIFLSLRSRRAEHLFQFWVFMPFAAILVTYILAIVTGFPPWTSTLVTLQMGVSGLILNLVVLIWAVRECKRKEPSNQMPAVE